MYTRLVVRSIRPKRIHGRARIRDSSLEAKVYQTKKKVLEKSLNITPMAANVGARKKIVEKQNRFGLKVSTTKIKEHDFPIDPKWTELKGKAKYSPYAILKAAEKEIIVSKKKVWKFSKENTSITGESLFGAANISAPRENRPLTSDSRTESIDAVF